MSLKTLLGFKHPYKFRNIAKRARIEQGGTDRSGLRQYLIGHGFSDDLDLALEELEAAVAREKAEFATEDEKTLEREKQLEAEAKQRREAAEAAASATDGKRRSLIAKISEDEQRIELLESRQSNFKQFEQNNTDTLLELLTEHPLGDTMTNSRLQYYRTELEEERYAQSGLEKAQQIVRERLEKHRAELAAIK